jgi:hypothetical protein
MTLHPSVEGHPQKTGAAVHGAGGVRRVGLDLRTLTTNTPLMVQQLTRPDAYPDAPLSKPRLHLGRAYDDGAPEVHFWAAPIVEGRAVGRRVPFAKTGGCDFVFAPPKLTGQMFLIQVRVVNDASKAFWPLHVVSFPIFGSHVGE